MKEMIMKNKGNLIGSSLVILLPIPIEGLLREREFVFLPAVFSGGSLALYSDYSPRQEEQGSGSEGDRADFLDTSDYLSAFLQRISFCPHRVESFSLITTLMYFAWPHVCCFRKSFPRSVRTASWASK